MELRWPWESQGHLGVIKPVHVTKKKKKKVKDELMAPLCFCGPHLEVITDVIQREFCKTQLEPVEEPRRVYCQREEEGEPREGVRFPHHEEIVWLGFWNHKMLSEANGRSGNAELETKGDELEDRFCADRTVGWRPHVWC